MITQAHKQTHTEGCVFILIKIIPTTNKLMFK